MWSDLLLNAHSADAIRKGNTPLFTRGSCAIPTDLFSPSPRSENHQQETDADNFALPARICEAGLPGAIVRKVSNVSHRQ